MFRGSGPRRTRIQCEKLSLRDLCLEVGHGHVTSWTLALLGRARGRVSCMRAPPFFVYLPEGSAIPLPGQSSRTTASCRCNDTATAWPTSPSPQLASSGPFSPLSCLVRLLRLGRAAIV